jgi:signal transduction histidine kinase
MEDSEKRKVLYLEDEERFHGLIEELRDYHHIDSEISHAETVEEAIELFKSDSFDVILCDYRLKNGRTGLELLNYVRKEEFCSIPFAIITQDKSRQVVIDSNNAGADYFFEKDDFFKDIEKSIESLNEALRLKSKLNNLNRKERMEMVFSVASHDLKNSSMVTVAAVELIKEDSGISKESRMLLDNILKNQEAIDGTFRFVRDYWNLGNIVNCWNQIHKIVKKISRQFSSNIRIVNNLPDKLEVLCDPIIEKVFYNLIENAIRHGKADIVECNFKYKDQQVFILIKDNGSGIVGNQKKAIFNQGFGKNTGYGLYFCREALERSDMAIEEIGDSNGACFVIRIPESKCRSRSEFNT